MADNYQAIYDATRAAIRQQFSWSNIQDMFHQEMQNALSFPIQQMCLAIQHDLMQELKLKFEEMFATHELVVTLKPRSENE